MSETTTTSVGFSWVSLLGVILVVLKVLGKISLGWTWVLAPFWMPLLVVGAVFGVVLAVGVLAAIIKG